MAVRDFVDLADAEPAPQACRTCGCTDHNACVSPLRGACWWVEDDLCSHCESPPPGGHLGPVREAVA